MALTLVTGGANAGKTGVVHARVLAAAAEGPVVLLVPSRPEVARASRELASSRTAGITVSTFDAYMTGLWALLGDGRRIVGQAQRAVLLRQAITATPMPAIGLSAARPGFVHVADLLVRRAGESGPLSGDRAARVERPGVARDLASVIDAYGHQLRERGLVESTEAHSAVSELLGAADLPGLVAINRFSSFTGPQERFIQAAIAAGGDLVIALTHVPDQPATRSAEALVTRLEAIDGTVMERVAGGHTPSEEIAHLEQNLFLPRPLTTLRSAGDLVISSAEGRSGEAQRITREIQILEESGISGDAIAVVFRTPELHEQALRRAFAEAGVRAAFDTKHPVSQTGLGRALALLLGFFGQGMGRAHLLGFLRCGYAWATPDQADDIDRRLRASRCDRGRNVLGVARGSLDSRTWALLVHARQLSAREITRDTVNDWKRLADEMLASAYPGACILDDRGLLDAAARRVLIEMIDELSTPGTQAGSNQVLELLGDLTVTADTHLDDAVQVMSAERARSLRFEAIILGGLTAGEFPLPPSEDALSSGGIAEQLAQAGIDVAPRTDLDAERLLFYQVVTGARRKLVISRMLCDDDGKPVRESQFLHELMDVYRDPVSGAAYGALPIERRLTLADLAESEDAPSAERRTLRAQAGQGAEVTAVARARRRLSGRRSCLTADALGDLADRSLFSVSEIETYLSCPYRWFYDRHLGPDSLDEAIDARTRGVLAHATLARFYAAWIERGHERVTPETLAEALEVHRTIAGAVLAEAVAPETLHEEQHHHAARIGSQRIIARDAHFLRGFAPFAHEYSFGRGDDPPEDMGEFLLKGQVDRIDVSQTALVVVDYKTSEVHPRAKFAENGIVQIPLYARVARRRLDREIAGGLYRSMSSYGDRGFLLESVDSPGIVATDRCTAADIEQIIDDALSRANLAVDGIRHGRIEQSPSTAAACTYCTASALCARSGR
ncbi:MAG: PD-(D/E)XK nuclease family protein [Coriobacteriia bacterium]